MTSRFSATRRLALLLLASPLLVTSGCNHVYDFDDPDAAAPIGCNAAGCPLASLYCDAKSGRCEACVEDANCTGRMHRCDPATHQCFECLAPPDCAGGTTCVVESRQCVRTCPAAPCPPDEHCDFAAGLCKRCQSNAECAGPGRERICDPASGRCVECLRDTMCAVPGRPRCDLATERCVECTRAADCPLERPVCDPTRDECVAS